MINRESISIVDDDPFVAHAKAVAMKTGVVNKKKRSADGSITLREAIESYIENRSSVLSPATVRGYHVILANRFPALMKMQVRDIDTE